jgi:hypothetical protein
MQWISKFETRFLIQASWLLRIQCALRLVYPVALKSASGHFLVTGVRKRIYEPPVVQLQARSSPSGTNVNITPSVGPSVRTHERTRKHVSRFSLKLILEHLPVTNTVPFSILLIDWLIDWLIGIWLIDSSDRASRSKGSHSCFAFGRYWFQMSPLRPV